MNHRRPPASSEDDRLLSARDAAAILGICTRQIWKLRATGALPATRIGRSTRFRMSDLQRLVKEGAK